MATRDPVIAAAAHRLRAGRGSEEDLDTMRGYHIRRVISGEITHADAEDYTRTHTAWLLCGGSKGLWS